MAAPTEKDWVDLPEPKHCFTVRSAIMFNLNNGKIVNNYSANTKIVVVQKYVSPICTYYRTNEARHHNLNYAFRAADFGLPDEKAPSAHSSRYKSLSKSIINNPKSATRTKLPTEKQTDNKKVATPKGGEEKQRKSWFKRLFRRKNVTTKNS